MTEQWTPRNRDAALARVRRTTLATGAAAAVIVSGIAYGLNASSTAATVASTPVTVNQSEATWVRSCA